MALISRFGASAGLIAALSMTASPALAADLPQGLVKNTAQGSAVYSDFDNGPFSTSTYDSDTDVTEWRRWGRRGWRRRGRVRAGDVLAGVLILGGIAAVASAANNNRRRDRDVVVVERDRDRDYDRRDDRRDNRNVRRNDGASGLQGAVDMCLDTIQRDVRVDSVNGVDRTAQGWIVTGALFNGSSFTCAIDNNGRIDAIDYGNFSGASFEGTSGEAPRQERADGQWNDDAYIAARQARRDGPQGYERPVYEDTSFEQREYETPRRIARNETERPAEPLVPLTSDQQPAYPGGPLPGEELPE